MRPRPARIPSPSGWVLPEWRKTCSIFSVVVCFDVSLAGKRLKSEFLMSESLAGNLLVASTVSEDPIVNRSVCLLVHDDADSSIGVMLNRPMRPSPEQLLSMLRSSDAQSGGEHDFGGEHGFDEKSDGIQPDDIQVGGVAAGDGGLSGKSASGGNRIKGVSPKGSEAVSDSGPSGVDPHRSGTLHFGGPLSGPIVAIHTSSEYAEAETGRGVYFAAQKQHLEELVRRHPVPYRLIVGHLGWTSDQLREEIANGFWHVLPATAEMIFAGEGDLWPRLIRRATSGSVCSWIGTPDVVGAAELN